MNTLKSAFWDYPDLTDDKTLRHILQTCRDEKNIEMYKWLLRRLLEYGRAVDAMKYLSIDEIRSKLNDLQLSNYAERKWRRLVEVYGES